MATYTLRRTGQTPLIFEGEEIACIYGRWDDGVEWGRYHNLAVYRTDTGCYVLSIQYRTDCEDEQPHDRTMVVQDLGGLEDELAAYDPTSGMEHRWPGLTVRSRYEENAAELLNLVQRVEQGQPPPLRHPVVIQYGEIDPEVKAYLQSLGATEGVSGAEMLRRAVEREMTDEGEGGALVVIVGGDDRDDEAEDMGEVKCVDCGASHLDVFYTSGDLGYSLCQSCFKARAAQGRAKKNET
jgi:hypothetical protein